MSDIDKQLFQSCKVVAKEVEEAAENCFWVRDEFENEDEDDAHFYFDESYNIDYIWRIGAGVIGVRVMVACGGPNIWVDTYDRCVHGYWGASDEKYPLTKETCDAIDDVFREFAAEDIQSDARNGVY